MRRICSFFVLAAIMLSVTSCTADEMSALEQICAVRESFSEYLGAVSVYNSGALQGEDGYADGALLCAMLGGAEYPSELHGAEEYAFLCSSQMELCEVWSIKCRTYSSAREVYGLLNNRKELLTSPDYENDRDAIAADGAELVLDGKNVYFAVNEKGQQIVSFLIDLR